MPPHREREASYDFDVSLTARLEHVRPYGTDRIRHEARPVINLIGTPKWIYCFARAPSQRAGRWRMESSARDTAVTAMEIRGETRHRRACCGVKREFEERISGSGGRRIGNETIENAADSNRRETVTRYARRYGKKRRKKFAFRKDIGIRLRDDPNDARGKKLDLEDVFFGGKGSQSARKNRG